VKDRKAQPKTIGCFRLIPNFYNAKRLLPFPAVAYKHASQPTQYPTVLHGIHHRCVSHPYTALHDSYVTRTLRAYINHANVSRGPY
jgi:hypothetical protein